MSELTDESTRIQESVVVHRDVRIPTGEPGVTLSGDLFLPADSGPAPVLITVLPYRRDMVGVYGSPTDRWFAARGFASLLVDMRGTGSSDGDQRPPFDPGEADDAISAIEWAAEQPWCDGAVGMWGHSYGAIMAMRTASRRPPALRAIVALQGTIDPGRDIVHPGGTRGAFTPLGSWALGTLFSQLLPPLDDYEAPAEQDRWMRRLQADPYALDLVAHGPGHPVWDDRRVDATAIEVPALCVAGWRDLLVDGSIQAFEEMSGPKRLIAGPWMHCAPQDSPHGAIDYLNITLAWWNRWLRDTPTAADDAPPVSVYVQGDQPRWLAGPVWPLGQTSRRDDLAKWHVHRPSAPDATVGVESGLWATPLGLFGLPLDQHSDDVRSLCHTSDPLDQPLVISGRPSVLVTRPWPTVSVKLADVDPAGRSTLICAGLASTEGDAGDLEVALAPTTYQVPAGHRLRVVLAPGDFPRVWPRQLDGSRWPAAAALSLPVVSDQAGEIEYPPPAPENTSAGILTRDDATDAPPTAQPVWEIVTDPLNDSVAQRLAYRSVTRSRDREHVLAVEQEIVATARRADPGAATIDGTMTATIAIGTGQRVSVDVEMTITASGLDAHGRLTIDGEPLLDQRWNVQA